VATWKIRTTYANVFIWVKLLATRTGQYGSGKKAVFNFEAYMNSVSSLIHNNTWPAILVGATLITFLIFLYFRKIKLASLLTVFTFFVFLTTLVFAKFPSSRYLLINYVLIVFIFSIYLTKIHKFISLGLFFLSLFSVFPNLTNYHKSTLEAMDQAAKLDAYVENHPHQKGVLWEWGKAKDFSFLWSRDWAYAQFEKEISLYRPDLFLITSDFKQIKVNNRQLENVFDVCWDKFYIQTVSAPKFMEMYPEKELTLNPLPNNLSKMSLIESEHCLN